MYGAWRPKHLAVDQTAEWFEHCQSQLRKAGCNLVIIQPWHRYHGRPGIVRHMKVVARYPEFAVLPYIDHVAFSGFEEPIPDPSHISGPLLDRWVDVLSYVPEDQWLRRDGRRCFGLITDFEHDWSRDAVTYLQTALQERYRDDLPCLIFADHNAYDAMDVELQINLFTNRRHRRITPPTAAVRPGFIHVRDTTGPGPRQGRYVPREGGEQWQLALRSCLSRPGVEYVFIESWNERGEGSNIEPCRTRAEPDRMVWWPEDEYWGRGPRRYLKILKKEIERWALE